MIQSALIPEKGCFIAYTSTNNVQSVSQLIRLFLVLIVLILSLIKFVILNHGRKMPLVNILFQDGIIYFLVLYVPAPCTLLIACQPWELIVNDRVLVNILSVLLLLLNLNPIIGNIALIPAFTFSGVCFISKSPLYHLILLATIRHYWPLFVTFVTFSILVIKKSTRLGMSYSSHISCATIDAEYR